MKLPYIKANNIQSLRLKSFTGNRTLDSLTREVITDIDSSDIKTYRENIFTAIDGADRLYNQGQVSIADYSKFLNKIAKVHSYVQSDESLINYQDNQISGDLKEINMRIYGRAEVLKEKLAPKGILGKIKDFWNGYENSNATALLSDIGETLRYHSEKRRAEQDKLSLPAYSQSIFTEEGIAEGRKIFMKKKEDRLKNRVVTVGNGKIITRINGEIISEGPFDSAGCIEQVSARYSGLDSEAKDPVKIISLDDVAEWEREHNPTSRYNPEQAKVMAREHHHVISREEYEAEKRREKKPGFFKKLLKAALIMGIPTFILAGGKQLANNLESEVEKHEAQSLVVNRNSQNFELYDKPVRKVRLTPVYINESKREIQSKKSESYKLRLKEEWEVLDKPEVRDIAPEIKSPIRKIREPVMDYDEIEPDGSTSIIAREAIITPEKDIVFIDVQPKPKKENWMEQYEKKDKTELPSAPRLLNDGRFLVDCDKCNRDHYYENTKDGGRWDKYYAESPHSTNYWEYDAKKDAFVPVDERGFGKKTLDGVVNIATFRWLRK
jgi:hypothetical protein